MAEGVEDFETKQLIIKLGCKVAQGFYFSQPLAAHDIVNEINESGLSFGVNSLEESKL